MKNILKTIVVMIAILGITSPMSATTLPADDTEKIVLVKNQKLTFSIFNMTDARSFRGVTYNNVTKMLKIDAKEKIAFVEIFNDRGELQYLLPIGAKFLHIDILDFEKGSYSLNIKLQEAGDRIIKASLERTF